MIRFQKPVVCLYDCGALYSLRNIALILFLWLQAGIINIKAKMISKRPKNVPTPPRIHCHNTGFAWLGGMPQISAQKDGSTSRVSVKEAAASTRDKMVEVSLLFSERSAR